MKITPQTLAPLPRRDPDHREGEAPLATAQWLSTDAVLRAIKAAAGDKPQSPVILGQLWDGERNRVFVSDDDRHLITIAGSRAGKGRGLIVPNLLTYPGSVVCIDPKGENAAVTARYRSEVLGQNVVILDPFGVLATRADLAAYRGTFNPFEWINRGGPETIDDVATLADAIIVRDNDRDPHWNETARSFLKGVMLLVMSMLPTYREDGPDGTTGGVNWTLGLVRRLASVGLPSPNAPEQGNTLEGLIAVMKANEAFDGAIAAAGHLLEQMGDKERGGVLSNLRRHTESALQNCENPHGCWLCGVNANSANSRD
jgi:type IV secretion system protein VirD4